MANLLEKASIILTPTAYDDGKVLAIKPSEAPYGDFDFTRNSSATRVNAQGLVEDVQILSSNLVQNGDFSQIGSEEVTNGSFSQEGVEEITNGDFNGNANGWNVGDWTYSNGKMVSNGAVNLLQSGRNFTVGKFYKITYTIQDYVSGGVVGLVGASPYAETTERNENGVFTEIIECQASGSLFILQGRNNFIGSIDNVSVKEVGQDWTLGTGWSIGDDKAIATNANSTFITQASILTSGKTYKITYTIQDYTSGGIRFRASLVNGSTNSGNGTYTDYIVAGGTPFSLQGLSNFSGSITNISVKEVGQNWTLGSGVSIGDNKTIFTSTPSGQSVGQNAVAAALPNGALAKVSFEVLSRTEGSFGIYFSGTLVGTLASVGVFTGYFTKGTETSFYIRALGTTSGSISNVNVIQITDDTNLPRINYSGFTYQDSLGSEEIVNGDFSNGSANWIFSNSGGTYGWRIENDRAICDSNASTPNRNLNSTFSLTNGKSYKVTLDILQSEDEISIIVGATVISNAFPIGTNLGASYIINSSQHSGGAFSLYAGSSDLQEIDNVSVKEYLGQEVVPDSGCGAWLFEPESLQI